jgi:putative ABC transport system permease protein
MFDRDKWIEILSTIQKHKLRTILTAFGVAWGIFMLVVLLGAGSGLSNSVEYQFRDDALNSIWIWRGTTSKPYQGLKPGRRIQFKNEDFDSIKDMEGVNAITGRYWIRANTIVSYKGEVKNFNVRCVHPDHKILENTIIRKGRYLNNEDINQHRKVAVIGKLVAEGFFPDSDPIGDFIDISGNRFQIVGVFDDTGGEWELRRVYIPISTAQRIFSGQGLVDQIMFTAAESVEESKEVEEAVKKKLAQRLKFAEDDSQAIWVNNNQEEFQQFQSFFMAIRVFVWIVGIGSILAGIIGVSNIMLIIVKDRTKEIGIRKSIGATPRDIIGMILHESIFITSIAGYLGLAAGVALIYGVDSLMEKFDVEAEFFRNPEIDIGVAIAALMVLIISGALAGLLPAWKAVQINPVTAMRT